MSHISFSKEDLEYLQGSKFSNSYPFKLSNIDFPISTRLNTVIEIVKGKRVLHIGCCDHIPLISEKVSKNIWLHGLLNQNCSEVIGIDIDRECLDYINTNYAKNAFYFNIETDDIEGSILEKTQWDYCILGEVLEHVDNAVNFLDNIKRKFSPICKEILITVPSAHDLNLLDGLSENVEIINSDHRYYFTPYTLSKVAIRASISPTKIFFADAIYKSFIDRANKKLLNKTRNYLKKHASTLVFVGKL